MERNYSFSIDKLPYGSVRALGLTAIVCHAVAAPVFLIKYLDITLMSGGYKALLYLITILYYLAIVQLGLSHRSLYHAAPDSELASKGESFETGDGIPNIKVDESGAAFSSREFVERK